MKLVKHFLLTQEEQERLQWVLDWYDKHLEIIKDSGINVDEDLYYIIEDVLGMARDY